MEQQSARAQKGEIEFRRKLFNQQVEGESVFEDEFDGKEISKILGERMKKTLEQMTLLKGKNIVRPPFVEIGAERPWIYHTTCLKAVIITMAFLIKTRSHLESAVTRTSCPL